jgi:hypothetical protein
VKGKDDHFSLLLDDNDCKYYELDPNQKWCLPGFVEEIYGADPILFRFVYEYLKINPNDYFGVDDQPWLYTLKDMERLKSFPYDPHWCYKNPKTGEYVE